MEGRVKTRYEKPMKKILSLALLMFVMTLLAAWSIGWFVQARNVKNQIEAQMASFPAEYGVLRPGDIDVGGFPLNMTVTLRNPSATLNMRPFLSHMRKRVMAMRGNSAGVLIAVDYPESTLNFRLDGDISFSLNALSDRLGLELAGTATTELLQGKDKTIFSTQYNPDTKCHVRLARSVSTAANELWNAEYLLASDDWFEEIREYRCALPAHVTTDPISGAILASTGASQVFLSHTPVGEQYHSIVNIQLKELEVTPAGDAVFNRIRQATTPAGISYMPVAMSLYGKQSLVVEANSDTPEPFKAKAAKPYRYEITRLEFTNSASAIQGNMMLASRPKEGKQQGDFSLTLNSHFTPAQSELARIGVHEFVSNALQNPEFAARHQGAAQAVLEEAAYNALPDISKLGRLTQRVRGVFTVDPATEERSFTITDLELSAQDFGINASAAGAAGKNQFIPSVNANIICRNCLAMIETMGGYMTRLETAAVLFTAPNSGIFILQPAEIDGLKNLLSAIGKPSPSQPANLEFVIRSGPSGMDINGKPLSELLALMQQYLAPAPTDQAVPIPPVSVH